MEEKRTKLVELLNASLFQYSFFIHLTVLSDSKAMCRKINGNVLIDRRVTISYIAYIALEMPHVYRIEADLRPNRDYDCSLRWMGLLTIVTQSLTSHSVRVPPTR